MKLLIVESPGKIKKLKSFLNKDWEVVASVGHFRFPCPDLSFRNVPDSNAVLRMPDTGRNTGGCIICIRTEKAA